MFIGTVTLVNSKFLFIFIIINNFKDVFFILTRKKKPRQKEINDIKKLADVSNLLNNELAASFS